MYFNTRRFDANTQELKISIPPLGTPFLLTSPRARDAFAIQEACTLGSLDWRFHAGVA
jgi:hypothetical protein